MRRMMEHFGCAVCVCLIIPKMFPLKLEFDEFSKGRMCVGVNWHLGKNEMVIFWHTCQQP